MKHAGSGTGGLDGFGQIPGQTLPPSLTLSICTWFGRCWLDGVWLSCVARLGLHSAFRVRTLAGHVHFGAKPVVSTRPLTAVCSLPQGRPLTAGTHSARLLQTSGTQNLCII